MMATVAKGSSGRAKKSSAKDRAEGIATAPPEVDTSRLSRARAARRVVITILAVFVLLGAATVFGARTATVSASAGGIDLTVRYPAVSRPGLAIRWIITVHRAGGFDGPIDLGVTSRYLDLFDFNNLDALPTGTRTDGELSIWTFDPPIGDTLVVAFDGRVEPAQQWGKPATVAVMNGTLPIVSVHYSTRLMP
jgi:hypothetical protein